MAPTRWWFWNVAAISVMYALLSRRIVFGNRQMGGETRESWARSDSASWQCIVDTHSLLMALLYGKTGEMFSAGASSSLDRMKKCILQSRYGNARFTGSCTCIVSKQTAVFQIDDAFETLSIDNCCRCEGSFGEIRGFCHQIVKYLSIIPVCPQRSLRSLLSKRSQASDYPAPRVSSPVL